jgi:hypothetical protein
MALVYVLVSAMVKLFMVFTSLPGTLNKRLSNCGELWTQVLDELSNIPYNLINHKNKIDVQHQVVPEKTSSLIKSNAPNYKYNNNFK